MNKLLIVSIGLCMTALCSYASEVNYSHSADLANDVKRIKLFDANYAHLPTKTEIQTIPGCTPNRKNGETCTKVVVLESQAVVQANVYYEDDMFPTKNGQNRKYLTLNFKLSDFSDDQVSTLIAAYPSWKHPFSNAPKRFAANNLELTVDDEVRTIQIVDASKSHLCRTNRNGSTEEGCVEKIIYKTAHKSVQEVTVNVK